MAKHLPSPGRSAGFSVLLLGFACLGAAAASGQTQKTEDSVDAKGAVEPAAVEEEITVYAEASQVHLTPSYAGGQVARGGRAGLLGNLDFLEAPFSGTAYTQALAETQQADSVGDVLRNDPGVRVTNGFGNFQEVYILRGFPVFSDDITLNGLFGILPRQFVAAELLERVEVFRGANAFINGAAPGASGSGGTVNLVQKRAPEGGVQKVSLGFENEGQLYAAVDVGRRFGADGAWGVRWNAALRDGETSVADQERELTVISLGTDYDGEGFRFSADVGYQDNRLENPRPQVTPFGAAPEVPDPDRNYAQPGTFTDEEQLFGVVRAELDVSDAVTLWVAGGGRSGEEANVLANPTAAPDGSTTAFRFDNTREDSIVSADVGGRAEFTTGSVGHRLVISASVIDTDSKNAFALSSFFAPFASDLFDPTPLPALPAADFFTGGDLDDPMTTEAVKNTSFAVADTLSLVDDRLLVTAGLRFQTLDARSFDFNTGAELSSYDEDAVTPVLGLVVKATERMSLYGNYAESLQPGAVAPASSGGVPILNAGEILDPFRGEQIEVGAKLDRGRFGGSLGLFSVNRSNAIVENQVFRDSG